jgi:hypothetical protein
MERVDLRNIAAQVVANPLISAIPPSSSSSSSSSVIYTLILAALGIVLFFTLSQILSLKRRIRSIESKPPLDETVLQGCVRRELLSIVDTLDVSSTVAEHGSVHEELNTDEHTEPAVCGIVQEPALSEELNSDAVYVVQEPALSVLEEPALSVLEEPALSEPAAVLVKEAYKLHSLADVQLKTLA